MPLVVIEGAETAIRYRNDIIRLIVQPYRQNFGEELVLMDDNSRPHRAYLVNEFLHDKNIARLEWPACFPDMNPIDHAWDTLKRAALGRDDPSTNLRDLRRFAIEEWDNLDQQDLDEPVDSMPRRVQACISARGRAARYYVMMMMSKAENYKPRFPISSGTPCALASLFTSVQHCLEMLVHYLVTLWYKPVQTTSLHIRRSMFLQRHGVRSQSQSPNCSTPLGI